MKKLLWDLDGVIRDLHSMIKDWNPQYWDDPLPTGESIFDYFKKNPNHLTYAEPTEYYKIIPKEITIITCQPEEWRQYTAKWLKVYCPKANIIYVDKPEDKFVYLKKDDLIIEDYPKFKDYSQVVLIDRSWNQEVENPYKRIFYPEQLKQFIEVFYNE